MSRDRDLRDERRQVIAAIREERSARGGGKITPETGQIARRTDLQPARVGKWLHTLAGRGQRGLADETESPVYRVQIHTDANQYTRYRIDERSPATGQVATDGGEA